MSGVFFHNTFAARKEILTKVFIFSIRLAISSSYINKDHRKKVFFIFTLIVFLYVGFLVHDGIELCEKVLIFFCSSWKVDCADFFE